MESMWSMRIRTEPMGECKVLVKNVQGIVDAQFKVKSYILFGSLH
jgi:hypothetical protein